MSTSSSGSARDVRGPVSWVWKYMTKTSKQEAKCKLCRTVLKLGSESSTKLMIKHLKSKKHCLGATGALPQEAPGTAAHSGKLRGQQKLQLPKKLSYTSR